MAYSSSIDLLTIRAVASMKTGSHVHYWNWIGRFHKIQQKWFNLYILHNSSANMKSTLFNVTQIRCSYVNQLSQIICLVLKFVPTLSF